ncbi:MAG: TSUP family transporter [Beijerinckiaceae bacterium]
MISTVSTWFGFPSEGAFAALFAAALLGGLVRGFTGFGFAMVFVPIATVAAGPTMAAALIWLVDIPFAWRLAVSSFHRCAWREILPMIGAAMAAAPIGVWLLVHADPTTARWIVALSILAATAALASGWRYRGAPGLPLSLGVGGMAGTASGLAQLGGMPVAIFWLAAQTSNARQVRDNLNGFFAVLPVATGLLYWWQGMLTSQTFWMALPLCVPYGLALLVGSRLFHLASERTFRMAAYVVITMAALIALPLLDPLFGR